MIGGSFTDSLICGTDTLRNNGRTSGYVARLSGSTGAWRWAKRTGNTVNTVTVSALAVAPGGDIVAMGSFDSHFDWDGTLVPNSYNYPLTWVGAVTPAGQLSWVAQTTAAPPTPSSFGTTVGRSVAVDGQGNVYMTGIFSGLATFGATTLNSVTSQQSMDGFVARLDGATHQWSWAVGGGTVADDEMGNVVVDGAGPSVYVTGTSASGVSGGGPTLPATYGPFTLPGSGASDLFVARLNAATGAWEELLAATGSQREWGLELAREPVAGSFVVAGWTEDGVTRFGPIPLGGGAGTQGFVARFGLPLGVREGKALAGAPDVWPNPARGTARIRLGQEEEGPLALLDAVGRPVRTVELAEGQREATLDLQGLPAGLYLLRAGGRSRRLVVE